MKQKPSRTFVYLALTMMFLFVIGMLVVGMLVAKNRPISDDYFTASAVLATNSAVAEFIFQTTTSYVSFTPIPYDASMSPTAVMVNYTPMPTLTPTLTFTPLAYSACSWQWASQPLPDVGMLALEAFIEAEMIEVGVRAEAYGENCLDGTTNTVNYFAAMTTDFYVVTPVENLMDGEALAEQAVNVYNVLITLSEDELPARLGYLDITFNPPGTATKRLRAMFSEVKAALEAGLTGEELLEELGGLS